MMTEAEHRQKLKQQMEATAKNEPNWHYAFRRPLTIPTEEQADHGVVYADCSFGVKDLCALAGVPDPTGNQFNGWGNSTSIYLHLPHIELSEIQPGDIVLFGVQGSVHATMVYAVGKRTADTVRVWSHGQERGPIIVTLAVEVAAHPGQPVTFCRAVAPTPLPPRPPHWYVTALTEKPLWAWISWRDHGHKKGLRPPHVPKVVPPWWWRRYAKHLGAGNPG